MSLPQSLPVFDKSNAHITLAVFTKAPCLEQLPLLHIPSGPSQAAENLEEEAKKTEEATKPRRFG